jgi:hypothetical protein
MTDPTPQPDDHVHEWQPGPLLDGHTRGHYDDTSYPMSLLLVCRCGLVERVVVPSDIRHVWPDA